MAKLIHLSLILFFIFGCAQDSMFTDIPEVIEGYGSISGRVSNAQDGTSINTASVYVVGHQSSTAVSTDASGNYEITNAPSGNRQVAVSKTGYVTQAVEAVVTVDGATDNTNVSLLPTNFGNNSYVITVTWGTDPADLDATLVVPTDGGDVTLNYDSPDTDGNGQDGDLTASPFAEVDTDAQGGNGPETMTIKMNVGNVPYYNATYKYYIHSYTNGGLEGLKNSSAVVRVFKDAALIKSYAVSNATFSATTNGRYWHVFNLDGAGNFTDIEDILDSAP